MLENVKKQPMRWLEYYYHHDYGYYHMLGGNVSVKKPSVQPMRRNCCLIGTSLSSWPGLGRRMMIDDAGDDDYGDEEEE